MSTHLHVRSCYTLLQSTMTISKIIESTKQHGYDAVALTDKNVMHGAMSFYHACKKENIKPIIGMEVDMLYNEQLYGLILLAKNDTGYMSLMSLSTLLNTNEHSKQITMDQLQTYTEECIVLTSGDQDSLETFIIKEEEEVLRTYVCACHDAFKNFYVAISRNDSGLLKSKQSFLKNICQDMDIKTFALSRIYFQDEAEEESYKTLCAIDQGLSLEDKMLNYSPNRYYRSSQEMAQLYDEDDLLMSDYIAQQCNLTMQLPKASLPTFQNKYQVSSEEFLRSLCQKGLAKRMEFKEIPMQYQQRLEFELDVIIRMKYADYFLIVWDFIRFAKSKDIFIGPGRGSAAGSLVSYCLGITHVDPIAYDLLFERFLNPERISMPDIDTDFPDNRRDEVIAYVKEQYGEHRASHIITFNTLAAKQVLRDVGRTMNIHVREIDALCKLVPYMPKVTLAYTYQNIPRFKQMINSSKIYQRLFTIAQRLEGLPRHASLHAAGIILSNEAIDRVCPLIDVDQGICATQFTMEYLEELGLIKMDFLGLRNLTIIDEVLQHIKRATNKNVDIMHLPLDDKKTYELIQAVDTVGVFQLESEGMKNLIRQMKPHCFEDIVATIALFRPGPMENIPEYLARRANPDKIDYIFPVLEPILKPTYGIMIYQEQIMQTAQVMAGFSLGKADNLRKAISKKKGSELSKLQQDFITGAKAKGYDEKLAIHVYELIMKFANYGFGRAHSVAYGMIAYQMAYLKANAPLYFFTSLLDSVIGSETKTSEYIFEAKKRRIQILLPSINTSQSSYVIEQNALRFPLTGIKGVGVALSNEIMNDRNRFGPYKDYFDFVARMSGLRVGKKSIEILIHAGALDVFSINRASLLASLDDALRYGGLVKIEDADQIIFDFDIVSKPAMTSVRENAAIRAQKEKEALGFYLSKHPIEELRNSRDQNLPSLISLKNIRGYVKFVCVIEKVKQHRTKKGDLMAFVVASDETSKLDLACMPNIYEQYANVLVKGKYFYVEGVVEKQDSCLVKKMVHIEQREQEA